MEILDMINIYLADSPHALAYLELMFKIKFWLLFLLTAYFLSLPYREQRKRKAEVRNQMVQPQGKTGKFWA